MSNVGRKIQRSRRKPTPSQARAAIAERRRQRQRWADELGEPDPYEQSLPVLRDDSGDRY